MTASLTRGRITRGGILRGGVATGGILRSQRQNVSPYAFNLDLSTFKDTVTGQSLSCNIDGTRYDEVDGVTTAFGTDTPTIADNGLRICGAYTNYALSTEDLTQSAWIKQTGATASTIGSGVSQINVTTDNFGILQQSLTTITAGTIVLISAKIKTLEPTGILRLNEASGYSGIGYYGTITQEWLRYTYHGVLSTTTKIGIWFRKKGDGIQSCFVQQIITLTGSKYYKPYIPTTTDTVSSPSEAGNSSTGTGIWIDDVATNFPLLNTALTSQGTLTFKWKTGFNYDDVSGNLNILSFNGTTTSAISYDADNNLIKITDGTNTASKALTVVSDTEYTIQATWGLVSGSPKMAIAVNGTAGSQADFTGTFNPSDIYFGLNNEELQYVKDMIVYKEATWL